MSYPAIEVNRFRDEVTLYMNHLRDLDRILAIIEDQGADDAARQTYATPVFDASYDLTWAQFASGVVALRAIRTARDSNKLAIAKLVK